MTETLYSTFNWRKGKNSKLNINIWEIFKTCYCWGLGKCPPKVHVLKALSQGRHSGSWWSLECCRRWWCSGHRVGGIPSKGNVWPHSFYCYCFMVHHVSWVALQTALHYCHLVPSPSQTESSKTVSWIILFLYKLIISGILI
jgi:hypothetical protein